MFQVIKRFSTGLFFFVGVFIVLLLDRSTAFAGEDTAANSSDAVNAEPYQTLRAELLQIRAEDKKYRLEIEEIRKSNPKPFDGYERTKELLEKMKLADAENTRRVKTILSKHGWLGPDKVGKEASETLFFVIQHADPDTQKEHLPLIRQAAKDKKLPTTLLPFFEDRVALHAGRRQTYGTQIGSSSTIVGYFVRPLEDPDNVDKRRAEVGLEPLTEYVKHWGIVWDVEAYKTQLPELEAIQKTTRYSKPQQ